MSIIFTAGAYVYLLGALWGACAFPLYGIAVAHANDHADREDFVEVCSGLLLVSAVGSVSRPILASVLMALTGAGGGRIPAAGRFAGDR